MPTIKNSLRFFWPAILLLVFVRAEAYEAVPNGRFDTNISGWELSFGTTRSWDTRDSESSPSSGSFKNTTIPEADFSAGYGSARCVPALVGGSRIRLSAKLMIPSGQPRSPFVGLAVRFYNAEQDCNMGFGIGDFSAGNISPSGGHSLDTWYTVSASTVAPPGTVKMHIFLTISGGAGTGSAIGLYDNVSVLIAPPARADLDVDGDSDVVWRHGTTGQNVVWFMNGLAVSSSGFPPAVPDGTWKIVNSADFDADGRADLLWRNNVTGQVLVWLMNGVTRLSAGSPSTVADLNWAIRGVGDFDGNGKTDIVWRHAVTGENAIWLMNGTAIAAAGLAPTVAEAAWQIVGVGDFNADGRSDLLWRHNSSGANVIWHMNGLGAPEGVLLASVADANWKVAAVGDTNANGKADILWRNGVSGQVVVWLMDVAVVGAHLGTVADTNWTIQASGDFNKDEKTDLLWRHSGTGDTVAWLLDGSSILSAGFLTRVADTQWSVVAPK